MPTAIAVAIVGTSATAFTVAVVASIVSVGLSYLARALFTPEGEDTVPEDQGVMANTVSNLAPVPVIYGYRKVGGSKVYQEVTNDNKTFWAAVVIGEGEIQGIEKIFIDDDELVLSSNAPNSLLTTTSSKDGVSVNVLATGIEYRITKVVSDDWVALGGPLVSTVGDTFTSTVNTNIVDLATYGSVVEVDFGADETFPINWDADKRLFGLAYVMCKFTYDRDVFRGIPNITVEVKGIKVPDIMNTITDKKWDRNPAAVLYDYLTNTVYGRGLDSAKMDLTSFQSAYTHCETALDIHKTYPENFINTTMKYKILTVQSSDWTSVGGPVSASVNDVFTATSSLSVANSALLGTVIRLGAGVAPPRSLEAILGTSEQKIYRLDGVVNVDRNTFENTKLILASCRGFLIFSAGKYKMVIDKFENEYSRHTVQNIAQVPTKTPFLFNEDNMVGALDITLGDKSNTYNRARYNFYNPQNNWMFDTVYFDDISVRDNSDRGVVLEQKVRMDFVASRYCAQNIVKQNIRQSRQQIIVGFLSNLSALANDVGDIVDITNENAGWDNKQFRVLRLELQEDGNVRMAMVEYNPGVYDANAVGLIFENDTADTDLPNPFSTSTVPDIPTVENANLSGKNDAGIVVPVGRVKVYWPEVTDPFVDYYELQYAVTDQVGTTVSGIVEGDVYQIITTVSTDWSAAAIGGPAQALVGNVFVASSTVADISGTYGTVAPLTADDDGYSSVSVPFTQIDVSNNVVEYIENLSPTTGYSFRARFVRTNSVYSGYSPVRYFVTAGVSQYSGAAYASIIEATSGSPAMLNNVGTVTYTAFLLKGGVKSPNQGVSGSEINSYDWYYAPAGGSLIKITNSNKATVTGSTVNNALGGSGTDFNSPTLTVEADGTALGVLSSGSATFSCEIDYTAT